MRRYSPEERDDILKAFKTSGMTQREFTRSTDLNYHTLQHWLHHKPKRASAKRSKSGFVEVRPMAVGSGTIRLHVAAGVELSLSDLPPPAYLAELARTLAS